jgi:hypothetical protein
MGQLIAGLMCENLDFGGRRHVLVLVLSPGTVTLLPPIAQIHEVEDEISFSDVDR